MTAVLINPGSGPIDGGSLFKYAKSNIEAFIDDLDLSEPDVTFKANSRQKADGGRYVITLHRGVRSVEILMPGVPLDEVRYVQGLNPWNFPRPYVDGSSWLWSFAVNQAKAALADHDGSVERRIKNSEQRCDDDLTAQPRCATCGTVRDVIIGKDGMHSVRCLGCNPEERRETIGGAVYADDQWELDAHFLVIRQEMPPEVPGHDDPGHPDALCGHRIHLHGMGADRCRLRRRHDGKHEPYWRVIERTYVDPDFPRRYTQSCNHAKWEPGTIACPECGEVAYAHSRKP